LAANKLWADVTVGELFATPTCTCGCGSIAIERSAVPQNLQRVGKRGDVGTIYIKTADPGLITIILFEDDGYLSGLEVLYDDDERSFQPLPERWEEVQRLVRSGED